jgi:hypothetical protein
VGAGDPKAARNTPLRLILEPAELGMTFSRNSRRARCTGLSLWTLMLVVAEYLIAWHLDVTGD